MFAVVNQAGFLRRDERAGHAERLDHLLNDEFIAEKILEIGHG